MNKIKIPEEYIAAVAEPKRTELQVLHDLIRRKVPHLEPNKDFPLIGYGLYQYKYESGRKGQWIRVGLSANKTGISIHIVLNQNNGHLMKSAKERIGKASVGVSCIRFKSLNDINIDVIEELLEAAGSQS